MKFSVALFASIVLGGGADAFTAGVSRSAKVSSVSLRDSISDELGIPCEEECALDSFPNLPESVHPGVVSGQAMLDLINHAKENGYAIPAVNCVSSSGINACLEAARKNDAPIIIQFSSGGSQVSMLSWFISFALFCYDVICANNKICDCRMILSGAVLWWQRSRQHKLLCRYRRCNFRSIPCSYYGRAIWNSCYFAHRSLR